MSKPVVPNRHGVAQPYSIASTTWSGGACVIASPSPYLSPSLKIYLRDWLNGGNCSLQKQMKSYIITSFSIAFQRGIEGINFWYLACLAEDRSQRIVSAHAVLQECFLRLVWFVVKRVILKGIKMFLVENSDGRVVGNFVFSSFAEASRLAKAIGGDVVSATVDPALVYEGGEEKNFKVSFIGGWIASCEAYPTMCLDSGGVVRQPSVAAGNDFLSASGEEATVYIRAVADDAARVAAMKRRSAMVAGQAVLECERSAVLADRVSPDDRLEVLTLLVAGQRVSAIKFVREVAACGLREAAQIVDYIDDRRS